MALSSIRQLIFIPLLLATVAIYAFPEIAKAENKVKTAAAGIVDIIQAAYHTEQLNCSLHLDRRQCHSTDRCQQTLGHLKAAANGNHLKIVALEKYRSSRMARDQCLRSLIGDHASSLVDYLQVHTREMTRLHQRRTAN